jgi:tetratricopeptide (TPR) repeat protein
MNLRPWNLFHSLTQEFHGAGVFPVHTGEIADTYYLQGRHADAVDFFRRLLKLDARELNKQPAHAKLVRSLAALGEHAATIIEAQDYLTHYPQAEDRRRCASCSPAP